MQFFKSTAFLVAAAGLASAADITVLVGDGGLTFTPPQVTAAVGDNVIFEFRAKNHTVTQSSFKDPCTRLTLPDGSLGVDSGFQAVAAGATTFPQWSVTVDNATAPVWFYCAQKTPANHCNAGMVFAINPTADKTFDAFLAAAKAGASGGTSAPASSGAPTGTASTPGASSPAGPATPSGFTTQTTGAGTPATTGSATPQTSGTAPPANGNGALGMRVDSRAATALAVVGLVAGLIL